MWPTIDDKTVLSDQGLWEFMLKVSNLKNRHTVYA